ncbi:MAG: UDP-N-acetylmuramoyl-L-alanyl-D-glutamate--2,6-diaminopimelate ligase [Chlamydiota bacterium]
MKLKKLLQNIPSLTVKGFKDIEITGLCNNSKQAAPGYLFFAKKGLVHNGNQYITDALSAGIVALATDLYNPFLENVVQLIHPNVPLLESILAEKFYDAPSKKILTIGITGTNGKTTTSYLIKHLLDHLQMPSGLIGTIEWIVKNNIFPSTQTTPDILTNQKLLHEMLLAGCKSAVMEVSSHGLDQGRVQTIDFDIAIFTNLTQDHLDYHGTMESYALAKSKLFTSLNPEKGKEKNYPKKVLINIDSPFAKTMLQNVRVPILTYGLSEEADVRAEEIHLSITGSSCMICYKECKTPFHTPLIGKFNLYNCLAAIGTGLSLGYDLVKVLTILSSFAAVPGRMERIENVSKKHIFVDYAHTEDALKNVLESLREVTKGKVICVFGCGGNRDRLKRPKMGAVAEKFSDKLVITSDNPRSEPPELVIQEILAGVQNKEKVMVEPDRKKAIGLAIFELDVHDVLLIAGKGHENYQIFAHYAIHFDDRIVAKEYCR